MYSLKNQLNDDDNVQFQENLSDNDKDTLLEACNDVIEWLEDNINGDLDDYKEKQIDLAIAGVRSGDKKLKTSSLESIENILPRKLGEPLMLILEESIEKIQDKAKGFSKEKSAQAGLQILIENDSSWTNCLGAYLAKKLSIKGLAESVKKSSNKEPLYSELMEDYLSAEGS